MNKTLSIGLAGFSFTIEEHAYIKLSDYLAALRSSLEVNEADEVMHDIEIRMVEIFKDSLGKREVINDTDVERVISQIGRPEEIEEQEEAYFSEKTSKNQKSSGSYSEHKQLFRNPSNKMLGGVSGGLADYFGIDIVWIRLAFVLLMFGKGFGFLLYIILWIVVPMAKTASDFLKMKGKPVNFDNLKEESHKIVQFANESTERVGQVYQSQKGNINDLGQVLGKVIRVFFAIFFAILGLSFLIGSFAFFGINFGSGAVNVPEGIAFFLGDHISNFLLISILVLTFLIPAIIFTLIAIRLFAPNSKLKYTGYVIGALVFLWIGLLFVGGFAATRTFTQYNGNNNETENISIASTSDSLVVDVKKVVIPQNFKSYFEDYFSDGKTIYEADYPYIKVKHENVAQPYLIIKKEAKGYNQPINLNVPVEVSGNKILLPNYFQYSYRDRLRRYNANYELVVPKNYKVHNIAEHINFDDDTVKDDNDSEDNSDKVTMNIGQNTIVASSGKDSVIVNGKKVPKETGKKIMDSLGVDLKDLKDVNISIKNGKKEIYIKTK